MPALKATITGDESGLKNSLDRSLAQAEGWSKKFESTVNNKSRAQSAGDSYAQWWGEAMLKRDVQTATRANRARELLRQRADRQAASLAENAKDYAITANISKALGSGGGGGGGHGGHGPVRSGVMRESLVLLREIGAGNWSKVPGSASLLLQYMGGLKIAVLGVAAVLAAAAYGLYKFTAAMIPVADKMGLKSLAPQMEGFKNRMGEMSAATSSWANELKRGRSEADKLADSMKNVLTTTNAWAAADDKVADAEKNLALSKLEVDRSNKVISEGEYRAKKAAIENQYDQDKAARANKNRGVEITQLYNTAEDAKKKATAKETEVGGLSNAAIEAERAKEANAERIKLAEENLKKSAAYKQEHGLKAYFDAHGYQADQTNQAVLDKAREAQPGLITAADGAKANLEDAKKQAAELRKVADSSARDAARKVTESAAAFSADKKTNEINAERRAVEGNAGDSGGRRNILRGHLTSLQQQGAYAGPAGVSVIDIHRKQLNELTAIRKNTQRAGAGGLGLAKPKFS